MPSPPRAGALCKRLLYDDADGGVAAFKLVTIGYGRRRHYGVRQLEGHCSAIPDRSAAFRLLDDAKSRRFAGPRAGNTCLDPVSPTRRQKDGIRIGIVFNRLAHRNLHWEGVVPDVDAGIDWVSPENVIELSEAMARFAESEVDAIIVDGGDGTVREVIAAGRCAFASGLPRLVVIPSGKTNALAMDLGIPRHWTLNDAFAAIAAGNTRQRSPIAIKRLGGLDPPLHGFVFGTGAFVKATGLAQGVHRLGAFRGLAVAISIVAAVSQTMLSGRDNPWLEGDAIGVDLHDGRRIDRRLYLLIGSTLERLPLRLKPFGRLRGGLKLLGIEAPPRHVLVSVPVLLAGLEAGWLSRAGYHRMDAEHATVTLPGAFILDGERFEGGSLTIGVGAPLDFVVP